MLYFALSNRLLNSFFPAINFAVMHISWLGQTCLKLQTKPLEEEITLIFDPYKVAAGDFPRSFAPQIALFSRGEDDGVTLTQNPFIISTLGEFDIKTILLTSFPGNDDNLIFKITAEGMNLVHLGRMDKKIPAEQLDALGKIDVLFIPVGGNGRYLSPSDAAETVTALEPRIVIPMGFECDSDPKALPVSAFIKEIGLKSEGVEKKIILKQKDLPQEDMKLIVLEKNI